MQDEVCGDNVTNFYSARRSNRQRRNLERYLEFMLGQQPQTILVGEAPGYNGCRLTGVPFTSEHIIRKGTCEGKVFGIENGYSASEKRVNKEQTATSMWAVLEEFETLPLLWNAFPFHPYKDGNKESNRKPNASELEQGEKFLRELIKLFEIRQVIAVGNVADVILSRMKIKHVKVRHPSYGGKRIFQEQLRYNLKKGGMDEKDNFVDSL